MAGELLCAAYFRSSYRTYISLPSKNKRAGTPQIVGCPLAGLALCLDEKLAKASCAETDVTQTLLAKAHMDLGLM